MTTLERAIIKRNAYWMQGRSFIRDIEAELAEADDGEPDETTLTQLLDQLVRIEPNLKEINDTIEMEISLDDLQEHMMDSLEFTERIVNAKARVTTYFKKKGATVAHTRSECVATARTITTKLPELSLKKFDGSIDKWQDFWCNFENSIHCKDIPASDKFNYLYSILEGKAQTSISNLARTNENYEHAIKTLQDRFGRKNLLVNEHYSKLTSLQSVRRASDIVGLRCLYDTIEIQMRELESLGVVAESYGDLLVTIITQRIPKEIALEVNRRKREVKEPWKIRELIEALGEEIISRETVHALCLEDKEHERELRGYRDGKDRERDKESDTPQREGIVENK